MSLKSRIKEHSLRWAISAQGYSDLADKLRQIQPDLSEQDSAGKDTYNSFYELKIRGLHAFQCSLMLRFFSGMPEKKRLRVVDVGDSAGTHMMYLKELLGPEREVDTISVNLDPRAIEKITSRGLKACLCRAEDLQFTDGEGIDLTTSFEMVEHLHNPAIFFRRMALRLPCNRMLITVPYLKRSRVGLHSIRNQSTKSVFAEDEHIFELSPEDWTLLMLHAGWKVVHDEIYYQYPQKIPVVSPVLSRYWRRIDFEGFWGAILERDRAYSDLYKDWEE